MPGAEMVHTYRCDSMRPAHPTHRLRTTPKVRRLFVTQRLNEGVMSRNPLYTVFGLGLLAAQYLSPRAATTSVAQQREHEQLSIKFLRGVSSQRAATKAVENVVVALYAAIILALAALWVNSMSNTYAHDLDVRCGAQAMANFAAAAGAMP